MKVHLLFTLPLFFSASFQSPITPVPRVSRGNDNLTSSTNQTNHFLNNTHEACAVISRAQNLSKNTSSEEQLLFVPANLAVSCLTSVPLNIENSLQFLSEFRKYFEFQSTLAWAKNPPSSSQERTPVDVMDGFDRITANVQSNVYPNNYEFERDIRDLLNVLRDGHVQWSSKCLEGNFAFIHEMPIVQFQSSDGTETEIYAAFDLASKEEYKRGLTSGGVNTTAVSSISSINDEPILNFLAKSANNVSGFHDPDARWNSLFLRRVNSELSLGDFAESELPPSMGANFTVRFSNGTIYEVNWHGAVLGDFSNIRNGEDYYQANCIASDENPMPNSGSTEPETPPASPFPYVPGYPQNPLAKSEGDMLSSYLLSNNIGVLVIHTFLAVDNLTTFQSFVTSTLQTFKSLGVSKVLVDVTGNGGGNIVLGYDTFKHFFPSVDPLATSNMRAHPAAKIYYEAMAQQISNLTSSDAGTEEIIETKTTPFSYASQKNVQNQYFTSWEQAYGPVENYGDEFTEYLHWDLSSKWGFGQPFQIYGTGNGTASHASEPFATEDILIVGDGICSSTCTLFVAAMEAVGVKSVVYGGRPGSTEMQTAGGVEGSEVLGFLELAGMAETVLTAYPEQAEREGWAQYLPGKLTMPPASPESGSVNLRNSFRKGSDVPLEYEYYPAAYKMGMTKEMFTDQRVLWRAAAKLGWGSA